MDKLSPKHRLFVEAFAGDPIEAAMIAGLAKTPTALKAVSSKLMSEPLIQEALLQRSKYMDNTKKVIATREERQALWTQIMTNEDPYHKQESDSNGVPITNIPNIPLPIRLKASELLGKSEADFVEKIDMTSRITLTDIILGSYAADSDRSIEDIEAEYVLHKTLEKKRLAEPEDDLDPSSLDDLI